ncbi:MAG TPA: glycosyltransferase family 2 protein [Terriglobales bacterium]|nr:glycosyltransferase family 2 protein [Terriglobales bacterium]
MRAASATLALKARARSSMIEMPLTDVSIVLVTYNREKFLPRTLDCVLAQSYPNFELLICDDASTDGTRQICERYAQQDRRIRYIRNPRNLGMPGNLNNGIRLARHELVATLHDGDIYAPTLIEKWRAALLRFPSAAFVFNQYTHLSPDGRSGATTARLPEFMTGKDFLEQLVFADRDVEFAVWGTVMARRSVYLEMGLFDERYSFWADMDMWCRVTERYDVAYVNEPLILLPHRLAMPHLFQEKMLTAHKTIFRIHWNARVRHYRGRPRQMLAALLSMTFNFVTIRSAKLYRRLLRRMRPAQSSSS